MKTAFPYFFVFLLGASLSAALLVPRIPGPSEPVATAVAEAPEEAPSRVVQGMVAKVDRLRPFLDVTGEVVAESNVEVFPEVAGKVVSLEVKPGDPVIRGQTVMAQVDPSRPGAPYSLSPVLSPLTGVITSLSAQVGASVTPQSSLGTVGILGHPRADVLVPETSLGGLRVGLVAEAWLASSPDHALKAVVDRMSPVVDPVSRTKKVTLRLLGPTSSVPGLFARVRIFQDPLPPQIVVPQKAVLSWGRADFVYVNDHGTARRRAVVVGQSAAGLVEIRTGLKSGELLVVEGQEMLEDGAKIQVQETQGGKL